MLLHAPATLEILNFLSFISTYYHTARCCIFYFFFLDIFASVVIEKLEP
jgi:hypothetical protein